MKVSAPCRSVIHAVATVPTTLTSSTTRSRVSSSAAGPENAAVHLVCIETTADFLAYSKSVGNDLSTPRPEFAFPGLVPGNRWCLVAARWLQAHEAGKAPRVYLHATNRKVLDLVPLGILKGYALDLN